MCIAFRAKVGIKQEYFRGCLNFVSELHGDKSMVVGCAVLPG